MCGIAGLISLASAPPQVDDLHAMIQAVPHRGPDERGLFIDDHAGLVHSRLSIIDLACGAQPIHNEDKSFWITYNGEIFNYPELKADLEAKGHRFYTACDTEVLLHMYEEYGTECLHHLNGQFAFAVWDTRKKEMFLARDRIGIRPLHYTILNNYFLFASEIKSLFALPFVPRRIDPIALDQIFTFWTTLPGHTAFEGIRELPAGHYMIIKNGTVSITKYWQLPFCERKETPYFPLTSLLEEIDEVLLDAIRIRLRADVPVGAYLSGGLDSSGVTAKVAVHFNNHLQTFGVRFEDHAFDEGQSQDLMAQQLGVRHTELIASGRAIADAFGDVIYACEKPLLRTAPTPLFLLSNAVRQAGLKVVLTGEGADEFFGGYNIFREAKVRHFWARQPDSQRRPELLNHLYAYVLTDPKIKKNWQAFFARGLETPQDPLFSHCVRWFNTSRTKVFFSEGLRSQIGDYDACGQLRQMLPESFNSLDALSKAQYLESAIFLTNYLLSSQGDRVAMAHSVEIRLPYLDYRVMKLAAKLPSKWKILGLKEKFLLKKLFKHTLPPEVVNRPKHPYRAPIASALLAHPTPAFERSLSPAAIKEAGFFDAPKTQLLLSKLRKNPSSTEVDNMALAGIYSTQLLYEQYLKTKYTPTKNDIALTVFADYRSAKEKIGGFRRS